MGESLGNPQDDIGNNQVVDKEYKEAWEPTLTSKSYHEFMVR